MPVSPAVTAGIDWASSEHAVAVVDEHGIQRQRRTVPHTKAGIGQLVAMLSRAGVTEVGIERGDGPLVEALIAAPFTVYVIAPNQIRNLRRRCGSAGNKDDHFDAYVLADTLRTDRHRLTPLTPDTPATVRPADDGAGASGPGGRSGSDGQPATGPPGQRATRGHRVVL